MNAMEHILRTRSKVSLRACPLASAANMRTILSLVLIVLVVSASAVSLQVGTVRGFPGNTVEVPVFLR